MLAEDPIAVSATDYPYLPVDAEAFKGELPKGIELRPLTRFTGQLPARVWNDNLRHCALAAFTQHAGHELLWQGARSPYIRACVDAANREGNFAIKAEFGFTDEDLKLSVRTQETAEQKWEKAMDDKDTDTVSRRGGSHSQAYPGRAACRAGAGLRAAWQAALFSRQKHRSHVLFP